MPFLVIPGLFWLKGASVVALATGLVAAGAAAGAAAQKFYDSKK